ncbi:putative 3-hydroxybutyryl-CoA dehydrogenase [Sporomusa silvacetica DSM 10669]|uniref:3-hydroxybutyryl-CoA dehydrogenase n=1 Tax=Sporomusa silvacetica DSM 10669 TaxID=1123289 RepID=A0ABZ3ITJ4_9FIRM|nr:3-hydroxyacyl-CoA dehydrogenase family protein [Sporomusa silvacetica]OZC22323.1 putative 3-hydroxybutyryl-CoA dehydrogenase [Sporomusa silvacetica DSM 10669]
MKKLEDIKKVAVLGTGTMGPGIAQSFAIGGYEVCMYDRSVPAMEKARSILHSSLITFAEEGMIKQEDIATIFKRVSFSETLEGAVAGADFIMETIVENREAKAELYTQLDKILPDDVYIASNTSFLNTFEITPERRLPYTVIAHWYAPPQLIPLVEVVRNDKTVPEVVNAVMSILNKSGKTPVCMNKFVPGYIVNRMQMILNQEVFYLLDNGYCTAEDIDMAVKASFIPRAMVLGLVQRFDFTGLDTSANNFKNKSYVMPEQNYHPTALFEHVDKGELGVKTGKGFYDYAGRSTEEVLAKRDKQLFEVFKIAKKLMSDLV